MRPLVVLLGIVMGSTVSIALTWLMVSAVFLLMHDSAIPLVDDSRKLMATCLASVVLAAIAAASFYGELRRLRWRYLAHAALVALMSFAVWFYWPQK